MTKRSCEGEAVGDQVKALAGLPDVLDMPVKDLQPAALNAWLHMPYGLQPPALTGDAKNAFMEVDSEAPANAKLRLTIELSASYAKWFRDLEKLHRETWESRKGGSTWQWVPLALDGEVPRINMNVMLGRGNRGQHRRTMMKLILPSSQGDKEIKSGVGWSFLAPYMRDHSNLQGSRVRVRFAMSLFEVKGKDDVVGKAGITFRVIRADIAFGVASLEEPEEEHDEADDAEMLQSLDAAVKKGRIV